MSTTLNIAFIGFGEASSAFAEGLGKRDLTAFDILSASKTTHDGMKKRIEAAKVIHCVSVKDAIENADVIFSFVTADQAANAARSVIGAGKAGALFFDCNSCSPDTKRTSAKLIEADGKRYVDAAVMAPVYPHLHRTKIHISGPHSAEAKSVLDSLDMNGTILEGDVGTASSVKMIRSIMMKGLEATMMECVLSGRKAGVDDLVLASLDTTYPGFNFKEKAAYMMERVMVHGVRRAAEMREVALTIEQLGLENPIASATVEWQQAIGEMLLDPDYELSEDDYGPRADRILAALENKIERLPGRIPEYRFHPPFPHPNKQSRRNDDHRPQNCPPVR